ncbi:gastric triacylglycerol lipase-like isoform X1 [Daphnia pulicaria]|uniref:gastric triacylglycerol lipase-like isoform X1 n=1 Tax=Daphnia pulicaria TaxID=35523 RepID=UPI001EEA99C3|nr:gastric triacylglycerol lipase-like isoform X1 [Daphnia pulicaria]
MQRIVRMLLTGIVGLTLSGFGRCSASTIASRNPEAAMSTVEIIRSRGYVCTVYQVTTADGYILELHRIGFSNGRPVLLQHGLLSTDVDWITNPARQSLGFRLADLGYDVYLSNARGNTYSRRHIHLDPKKRAYWNFSYDEMGLYDVPANVDFILKLSQKSKLIYIGHSMGATMFYIAAASHPELNEKIDLMIGLAPVASMAHFSSPVKALAPHVDVIQFYLRSTRMTAFLAKESWSRRFQKSVCQHTFKTMQMCQNVIFYITGADRKNFNSSVLSIIEGHFPAGTSVNTLAQFAQGYNAGKREGEQFRAYNHGLSENLRRYGLPVPPTYNLTRVTAPVYLFWGPGDLLASPKDIDWLSKQLGNLQSSVKIDWPEFNHLDFLWGMNSNRLLYDPLISVLPIP